MTPRAREGRGLLWIVGGFLFCPCHLPLTLTLLGVVLAGTALGAAIQAHPVATGTIVTAIWLAATWRGLRLMNRSMEKR